MPFSPLTPAVRPPRVAPRCFRIALGAVVLDAPDVRGVALVADVASGWAFQIAQGPDTPPHRDAGACAGGRDDAMRCALLAALRLVPRGAAIHLTLEDGQDVHLLAQLIRRDPVVRAALAGRPRSAEVCPADRAVWQARLAAERVAEQRLRARAMGMPAPPRPQPDGSAQSELPGRAGPEVTRQIMPGASITAPLPAADPPAPPPAVAAVQSWFRDLDASIAALRTGVREVRVAAR